VPRKDNTAKADPAKRWNKSPCRGGQQQQRKGKGRGGIGIPSEQSTGGTPGDVVVEGEAPAGEIGGGDWGLAALSKRKRGRKHDYIRAWEKDARYSQGTSFLMGKSRMFALTVSGKRSVQRGRTPKSSRLVVLRGGQGKKKSSWWKGKEMPFVYA